MSGLVWQTVDFGDGIYEGETLDGLMHGQGTAKFHSGDMYAGQWRNDAFHGKGKYTWADGDVYEGEYVDGNQHGHGILKSADGIYDGEWRNDVREGFGRQKYANGDFYEGDWSEGMKQGKGKLIRSDGSMYEGQWLKDMHHGVGVARNANGDVYEGDFLNGKAHGKGTYRWSDGGTYVGYFKDGLKHGEGCERRANGEWVAGNWIEGEHDQKQKVHSLENSAATQQKLLEETLARLNFDVIQPRNAADFKTQVQQQQQQEEKVPVTEEPSASSTVPTKVASPSKVQPEASSPTFTDKDFEGWQTMKLLGKGSFGAVYEAGLATGQIVCVKIVELGSISNQEDIDKLNNEISLMKRLHHPNIVQYYGCVEDKEKNTINIFMEYVTGGSLIHYIKKFKTIPTETVRQWAYQMILGVHYLHACGIVHRDIKGDNILVTMNGVLKLADFGCSKAIDDVCSKTHGCKTMVGTPYWMAPEVIKCEGPGYGMKSDVWSVGCTVVEMVTGKPPWPECNSMWAAVYKIANSSGLPTEIPKDLPPELMDFLERCFERDPAKRASSEELLHHPWLQF